MSIFELATRNKYRFPSLKGELTVEQLWDLPLKANSSFDLDNVARTISRELRDSVEESFVSPTSNTGSTVLNNKLDIVKHIIKSKLDDKAKRETAAQNAKEKEKLLAILEQKDNIELNSLSREELLKRIDKLNV